MMQQLKSMEECLYFTNRTIDSGKAMAWVFKKLCPKCNQSRLGKPIKKSGKVDKKANYYECLQCKHQEPVEQVEQELVLNVKYTCPYCGFSGETTTEYKRKSFQGVSAYVFVCEKCNQKIGLTKKMKEAKKKEGYS